MPAFAIEFKGSKGSIQVAHLQCAFDGTIITEGARGVHTFIKKSDDDFYGKTQALTVAFNGELINYYGHYALPRPSQLAADVKYYPYLLMCDTPRPFLRNYRDASRHIRNAQGIGYKWATERKDALWAYTKADKTQTSPDVPVSLQSQNYFVAPISSGTLDDYYSDAYDDEADIQLRREYWRSQDPSMQIATTDDKYASPDALTYTLITPPPSSKDVSVPLESQQLPVPTVTEPRDDVDFNTRDLRKPRARTRHAVVEGPGEVVDNSKSRKTRKREC
jgi:hypothetical protein